MSTVTSTTTLTGQSASSYSTTLRASSGPSVESRLRSLIDSAGRAFLNHDYRLTQSLVETGCAILSPPEFIPDTLGDYRRRWDVLRITLEAHVYTSSAVSDDLPPHLKDVLLQSSSALVTTMYKRSLTLFTPSTNATKIIYIPTAVINALVYASIKLDCPDVGRAIIEDWLASRDSPNHSDAYKKLLAIYTLQILPALDQWDYAKDFLEYESELPVKSRECLRRFLADAYNKAHTTQRSILPTPSSSTPASPRSFSPAPSNTSSTSSLSTTSTHTVVPATPRGKRTMQSSLSTLPAPSESGESLSSVGTAKPRSANSAVASERNQGSPARSLSHSIPNAITSGPHTVASTAAIHNPGFMALLNASFGPIFNSTKLATFLIFAIVFPLISMVVRLRRRKVRTDTFNTADLVRKRLQAVNGPEASIVGRMWGEVIRVVTDTIQMGGSGLV